jgi:hypothetical protein
MLEMVTDYLLDGPVEWETRIGSLSRIGDGSADLGGARNHVAG